LGEYGGKATGQDLIRAFFLLFPSNLASFAHMQPHPQGSIFKLTVAYAALEQRLEEVGKDPEKLDPSFFTLTDTTYRQGNKTYVGYDAKGRPIPQLYKGGRIPKSVESDIGHVDLVRAIERSSNPYFSLLAGDYLESPEKMLDAARLLGYGEKTGIILPNEAKGRLPSDLEENKTGVYTTAIGQHTMLATPLQTTVALSALFSGEVIVPRLLRMAIGPESTLQPKRPYADLMQAVGVGFPLWVAERAEAAKKRLFVPPRTVKRALPICVNEQNILARGMKAVGERIAADKRLRGRLKKSPELLQALDEELPHMLGKSSTAQSFERLGPNLGQKPAMYDHTWFGGVFLKDKFQPNAHVFEKPELTVVVFLRYGSGGKEAAPLAAAVAREWRRIQKKHASIS
jgi:cell division protein FtsI/penicillin-binding protein 2